jgi:AcrR family transcriptional regulator
MSLTTGDLTTRERLLNAAGETFAERGFRAATIRDICERAQANVAAAHYHFGDKEELYLAVLKWCSTEALKKYPPTLDLPANAPAAEQLHAFVRSFLFRIADKGRPEWYGRLMAREVAEPTAALNMLIDDIFRPLMERLAGIVRELTGQTDPRIIQDCTRSILGQCLHYYHARPVIQRLSPEETFEPADLERIARHITKFSLAGLREYRS